jgi:transposase
MSIVGGLDIHRKQLTFDYVEEETGRWERGRITPADREHLAGWLSRFDGVDGVAFVMEGCTGWRYVAEEMRAAGVQLVRETTGAPPHRRWGGDRATAPPRHDQQVA